MRCPTLPSSCIHQVRAHKPLPSLPSLPLCGSFYSEILVQATAVQVFVYHCSSLLEFIELSYSLPLSGQVKSPHLH